MFDSNRVHKNPLITTGIVMLGILTVINCIWTDMIYFDPARALLLILRRMVSPYSLISIATVILGCCCTKNRDLFTAFRCTFFLPLIAGILPFMTGILPFVGRYFSRYSNLPFLDLIFNLVKLGYLMIVTGILARGVFSVHVYKGEGYLNMALHIVLLLILPIFYKTCWVFRSTRVMNRVSDEPKRSAFLQTLLCFIVPFYSLYWTYSTARRGDVVVAKRGVPSNTATLCLILRLFLPIIPPMIIQDKINQIVGDNRVLFTALQKEHIEKKPTPAPNLSIPDELKKYKELLDCQAITQEEYDKKKSELLNL